MAKTWLITGSSRGFGWELAKAVLADGDNVVATARRPEQLDDLVRQYGARVRACALDITDAAAARAAVNLAVEAFGSLDVVVNNAGYAIYAAIEDMPDDVFRAQIEANLFGVVNVNTFETPLTQEATPVDYDSESVDERRQRRRTVWTPTTLVENWGTFSQRGIR